ncbi:hypothetical protein M5K25_005949 [Dendrobium thyrsiflorum]|uniref:Uncharacterized protein n=1 Tax=Dendrobium thyrsiflorum TaxID=117978 RepID=A0ABD0VAP3_DENTH
MSPRNQRAARRKAPNRDTNVDAAINGQSRKALVLPKEAFCPSGCSYAVRVSLFSTLRPFIRRVEDKRNT